MVFVAAVVVVGVMVDGALREVVHHFVVVVGVGGRRDHPAAVSQAIQHHGGSLCRYPLDIWQAYKACWEREASVHFGRFGQIRKFILASPAQPPCLGA